MGQPLREVIPQIAPSHFSESHRVEWSPGTVHRVAVSPPPRASNEGRRCAGLTQRELEVLELLARGLQNKQICRQLDIAGSTVKVHVTRILEKLEVTTRVQAVVVAFRRNMLQSNTAVARPAKTMNG